MKRKVIFNRMIASNKKQGVHRLHGLDILKSTFDTFDKEIEYALSPIIDLQEDSEFLLYIFDTLGIKLTDMQILEILTYNKWITDYKKYKINL